LGRQEDSEFEASPGKVRETLSQKQNKNRRAGGVTQDVEHLSAMLKALGSIPSTITKNCKVIFKFSCAHYIFFVGVMPRLKLIYYCGVERLVSLVRRRSEKHTHR
jgi:hypothetical protein